MERNVPIVVLHDSEQVWYYHWNLLSIPANYARFNFCHRKGVNKVTTILTNDKQNIPQQWDIPDHDRILQAYSSPGQPVIQLRYDEIMSDGKLVGIVGRKDIVAYISKLKHKDKAPV